MRYNSFQFFDVDKLFSLFDQVGLKLNQETAGSFCRVLKGQLDKGILENSYVFSNDSGEKINFLDGHLFMKSLNETEKSFKMKLFVN